MSVDGENDGGVELLSTRSAPPRPEGSEQDDQGASEEQSAHQLLAGVDVEGVDGVDGEHGSLTVSATVTKQGRPLALAALVVSSVVALVVWQGLQRAETTPLQADRPLIDVVARQSPAPTVRWETPPKFGGRGGGYSQVQSASQTEATIRPGPYR